MRNLDVILSSAFLFAATGTVCSVAFGQGFGDYVAPSTPQVATHPAQSAQNSPTLQTPRLSQSTPTSQTPQTAQTLRPAQDAATRPVRRQAAATPQTSAAQSAYSAQPAQPVAASTPQTPVRVAQAPSVAGTTPSNVPQSTQSSRPAQSAQTSRPAQSTQTAPISNAFVPPPARYKLTENDRLKLDEFLTHWENFGKGIKQVSCNVHMMEFDGGVLQQDAKKPIAHTWGLFRFKTPNRLLYHVKGEFSYASAETGKDAVWKEGQNEMKIVLDGKALTQYDFENKKAIVYPLAEDERELDLTMDNGQFPLFFVAKAETLKNRFYLRLVTPAAKQQSEVWIEAFPRYARDAQQFQSIVVILGLKDMQPTYMRKVGVNGKSKTDLKFENVEVNKGRWTIEGDVPADWTKEERAERFSLIRQQPVETNYAQTPNAEPAVAPPARTATRPVDAAVR